MPSAETLGPSRRSVIVTWRVGPTLLAWRLPPSAAAVAGVRNSPQTIPAAPARQATREIQELLAIELSISILIKLQSLLDELLWSWKSTTPVAARRGRPMLGRRTPAARRRKVGFVPRAGVRAAVWARSAKCLQFFPGNLVIAIGVGGKNKLLDERWDLLDVECTVAVGIKPTKHLVDVGRCLATCGPTPPWCSVCLWRVCGLSKDGTPRGNALFRWRLG